MPIVKLPSGNYQAKLTGTDGRGLSATFPNRYEAEEHLAKWKRAKSEGALTTNQARLLTVDQFFATWFDERLRSQSRGSESGWFATQLQQYRDFVQPVIGHTRLLDVTPAAIQRVLNRIAESGRSPQLQVHVFGLLRKLFGDAIENYRLLTHSPALKKLKPSIPQREAPHLSVAQSQQLLTHVVGKQYGLAIAVQFYLGLRCGELQALTWDDLDLEQGWAMIRRVYVRKTRSIRDYPKGGKQHRKPIPMDVLQLLKSGGLVSTCPFVASVDGESMLSYEWYHRSLRRYCRELGLPPIGTHGLRHSTSEFYLLNGATKDDLQELFAHSSQDVTRRYIHGHHSNLRAIAGRASLRLISASLPGSGEDASTKSVHVIEAADGNDDKT